MLQKPVSPARAAAFAILLRTELQGSYASELLHSDECKQLSPVDRGLTTELVMGVLRWRSLLDTEIADVSKQPLDKLDVQVLTALRLGLYQLRWLDRIPARAAIHESVELVKYARKLSAATFVNAVLRKLQLAARPTRERTAETVAELAAAYAHPQWLVERWVKAYGLDYTRLICIHDQEPSMPAIRLVDARAESELADAGIRLAPGFMVKSARRVETGNVSGTNAFEQGRVVIQDEASQLVAMLLGRGASILDCCAAPGGKTSILAERNLGCRITAVELHPHRARLLRRLTRAADVHVVNADARYLPFEQFFDRVLVDAPCSGTGTFARNPEIKWRLRQEDLVDLQRRQTAILRSAMARVSPGSRLVYATCSLEQDENSDVVDQALRNDKSFHLLDCRSELEAMREKGDVVMTDLGSLTNGPYLRTIPGLHLSDGLFAAVLQKN